MTEFEEESMSEASNDSDDEVSSILHSKDEILKS